MYMGGLVQPCASVTQPKPDDVIIKLMHIEYVIVPSGFEACI